MLFDPETEMAVSRGVEIACESIPSGEIQIIALDDFVLLNPLPSPSRSFS